MKILNLEPDNFSNTAINELLTKHEVCAYSPYMNHEEIEGIITKLGFELNSSLLSTFPYLKFIATPTTGLNHIDLDYCKSKGIRVISLKGEDKFLADNIWSTAEHTIGLIFAITRKIVGSMQEGISRYDCKGIQLRGKTLGIVGYGRVGKQVAELGRGIGLNVLQCDITDNNYFRTLDTVLYNSDIVTLHADYRQENKRMAGREWFKKMRVGSYFINTSRGEMVNEEDLIWALKGNKLAGAAIDVVAGEHFGKRSNTLQLYSQTYPERLIITPHIAGCTEEAMEMTDLHIIRKILQEV